eukprot:COSAG02_NODE_48449_length_333_cov_1.726496_1_plen_82_part_00
MLVVKTCFSAALQLGERLDDLKRDIDQVFLEYRFDLATQIEAISDVLSSKSMATDAEQQLAIEDLNLLLGFTAPHCPARTH